MKEVQKTSPEWAFISIGSNIEPEKHIPLAIQQLHQIGELLKTSNVYQNPPVGRPEQNDFLNAAVLLETNLNVYTIRSRLREIEADLGRIRTEDKFAARTIDLDLCLLGDRVISSAEIKLPDPDLLDKPHLAIPMAELAPDFPHPLTGESLRIIADRLKDEAELTLREDVSNQIQEIAMTQSSNPPP